MLKIIACDDDVAFLDRLHRMIDRWSIETGTAVDVALVTRGEDLLARHATSRADIILLDMIMPHQGGHSTFYKLKALDPDVCVLLSSGFVSHDEVDDLLANGAAGFLPKPHRIATMAAEIRRILDQKKEK